VDDAFAAVAAAPCSQVVTPVLDCLVAACSAASLTSRAFHVVAALFPRYAATPTATTYVHLVAACGRVGDVPRALAALDTDNFCALQDPADKALVFAHVVDAAARCNALDRAFEIVERMKLEGVPRSEAMYAALIRGCAKNRPLHVALGVLRSMRDDDVCPVNVDTYNAVLQGCARAGRLLSALDVVSRMERESGLRPDIGSFNALLACCGKARDPDRAFQLLEMMEDEHGIKPNAKSYNSVVVACANVGDIDRAFLVADKMRSAGIILNVITWNNLLDACCNAGRIEKAFAVTREMIQVYGVTPNSFTYNTLIRGCGQWGQLDAALRVLTSMRSAGVSPTVITYSVAVAACAGSGGAIALRQADQLVHDMLRDGIEPNIVTYNSLIHACARASRVDRAFVVLDTMREKRIVPDMVTLCSLVDACGRSGQVDRAFKIMSELLSEFSSLRPTIPAYNALIHACSRAGKVDRIRKVFCEMKSNHLRPNVVSYSTLIGAHAAAGDMESAKDALVEMKSLGLRPNHLTYTSIITGYGRLMRVDEALNTLHDARPSCGPPDEEMYTSAIVAAVSGEREEIAVSLAEEMMQRGFDLPDVLNRMMLRSGSVERTGDELSALLNAIEALGLRPTRAACESVVDAYSAEADIAKASGVLAIMNRLQYPPNLRTFKKLVECCGLAGDVPKAQRLFSALRGQGKVPNKGAAGQLRSHHWIELYEAMLTVIVQTGDTALALKYCVGMRTDCGKEAARLAEERIVNKPPA
jgi:pentatricopeptide repeat protein